MRTAARTGTKYVVERIDTSIFLRGSECQLGLLRALEELDRVRLLVRALLETEAPGAVVRCDDFDPDRHVSWGASASLTAAMRAEQVVVCPTRRARKGRVYYAREGKKKEIC